LVPNGSVVDIGCGAGFFLNMLEKRSEDVFGIEPNGGMRKLASDINPHLKIIAGSAEEITQLITKPAQTVTMLDVLEHIEDDVLQLARVRSVLVDEGTFILVVPAYSFLYGKRDVAMGHYRRYNKASLRTMLEEQGFIIESMRYWNALGVLPYLISEKILKRPLTVTLREEKKGGFMNRILWDVVNVWMREVENRFNFGFGLSIMCVARKL
jgi:SAM-dependent methyltransferase